MGQTEIIILFLIVIILFIILSNNSENFTNTNPENNLNYIWTYWERKENKPVPAHITLCLKTMEKYCKNLIILNEKTVHDYLPNLRSDLDKLLLPQKVDYIRINLLYYYGGLWLDADTIIMQNLDPIFEKLKSYDFVGFGCSQLICSNGYPYPSNQALASRKHGILMKKCLNKLDQILDKKKDNFGYFDLGKYIIWQEIGKLKSTGKWDYYHFPSKYDGSRDSNGLWVFSEHHLSKKYTKLLDENSLFFVFLENNRLMNYPEWNWICNMTEDQILSGNLWISYLFRKSLKNN